jgi:hypothetical protein
MAAYDQVQIQGPPSAQQWAPPPIDFSPLAQIPAAMERGQQYGVQRQLQQMFPDGNIPMTTDANGNQQIDLHTIASKAMAIGGPAAAQPYMDMLLRLQSSQNTQGTIRGNTAPEATMAVAPSGAVQPAAPGSSTGQVPQGPPPNSLLGMLTDGYGESDAARLAPVIGKQIGVNPEDPLSAEQADSLRQQFPRIVQQAQASNPPPDRQPQGGPPFAPSTPGMRNPATKNAFDDGETIVPVGGAPQRGGGPRDPRLDLADQKEAEAAKNYSAAAAYGATPQMSSAAQARGEALTKSAQQLREAVFKAGEPTGPMKEAAAAGQTLPQYLETTKIGEGAGSAMGKRIGEVIESGGQAARHTLSTLNVMNDALDHAGTNISTGPGADFWLSVKQGAQNLFPDIQFKGLQESEIIKKLNAQLASESAKAMTARPSQLEFKAFMANNPGLGTSVQGTKFLIDVLSQMKQQDIALSRLAMNPQNRQNWPAVEDQFYADPKNQIRSPFTGQPLSGKEHVFAPPQGAIDFLRSNPNTRAQFEAKYGAGSSAQILGGR